MPGSVGWHGKQKEWPELFLIIWANVAKNLGRKCHDLLTLLLNFSSKLWTITPSPHKDGVYLVCYWSVLFLLPCKLQYFYNRISFEILLNLSPKFSSSRKSQHIPHASLTSHITLCTQPCCWPGPAFFSLVSTKISERGSPLSSELSLFISLVVVFLNSSTIWPYLLSVILSSWSLGYSSQQFGWAISLLLSYGLLAVFLLASIYLGKSPPAFSSCLPWLWNSCGAGTGTCIESPSSSDFYLPMHGSERLRTTGLITTQLSTVERLE